jgi:hypothetical protein
MKPGRAATAKLTKSDMVVVLEVEVVVVVVVVVSYYGWMDG